jgi:hypothetical protein
MSVSEKLSSHLKRWNIEIDSEAAFQIFKSRIVQDLEGFARSWSFWRELAKSFNYQIGSEAIQKDTSPSENSVMGEKFLKLLKSSRDTRELINYCQVSFIAIEEVMEKNKDEQTKISSLDKIYRKLFEVFSKALEFTPQLGVAIHQSSSQVIIYPKGAKLLDEMVVNQNLLWLESHPAALKHFEQALTQYMTGDKKQQRNLLDNLRFALEQLLRDILKNKKSLENQQDELLR